MVHCGRPGQGAIDSIELILQDKKAGQFKLEVAWIKGTLKQDR